MRGEKRDIRCHSDSLTLSLEHLQDYPSWLPHPLPTQRRAQRKKAHKTTLQQFRPDRKEIEKKEELCRLFGGVARCPSFRNGHIMLITDVCKDELKFKPMSELPELQGLSVQDVLSSLTEDEFVDNLPTAHRLRAKILYRELACAPPASGDIDLSGKVYGCAMGGDNTLANFLCKATPEAFSNAKRILLRNNYLVDRDTPSILKLVDMISKSTSTGVTLDLSGNRFSPAVITTLEKVVAEPSIEYVVVPDIGHIGAKPFLNKPHSPSFFDKLIFIPRSHIRAGGWNRLIDDADCKGRIEKTHMTFYTNSSSVSE